MLNVMSNRNDGGLVPVDRSGLQILDLLAILRRRKKLIAVLTLISFGLALAYVLTAPKLYTAQATMLIDARRLQGFRQESATTDVAIEPATVESQIETLKSDSVTSEVVRVMDLVNDPEFSSPAPSPISALITMVRSLFTTPEPDSEQAKIRKAIGVINERMEAKRVGLSYAIAVSFSSLDRIKAARVANQIAQAYLKDQIDSKVEATAKARAWLDESITQLEKKIADTDKAVLDYRAQNGIVDVSGKLVAEQLLAEQSTALTVARKATQEAKARYERIQELIKSGAANAAVTDSLRNDVLTKLRQLYLEINGRQAEWARLYGPNHERVQRLRSEASEVERSMVNELERIAQSYNSDFEIAKAQEAAADARITSLTASLGVAREAQPRLRELESNAQSVRTLYDAFKQRQLVATQQLSFDIGESRVITPASPPTVASSPRTGLILIASLALGLAAGCGAALLRELFDRRVRTTAQMEAASQAPCLGILPLLKVGTGARARAEGGDPSRRVFSLLKAAGPSNAVVHQPFSLFAETIRNIKVSIDTTRLTRGVRSLGVVSAMAGEGKTTVALNLALVIAQSGSRVLLIDADMRNPQLTRTQVSVARNGLAEVLTGEAALNDVIWTEAATGMHVLPTVTRGKIRNSSELIASDTMRRLLEHVAQDYDYVILDCAPITPVVDVRASAHLIDGFVLVAAWGDTSVEAIERAASADFLADKLLGTVITRVDIKSYKLFETYQDSYYLDSTSVTT